MTTTKTTKPITRIVLDGVDLEVPEGTTDYTATYLLRPVAGHLEVLTWKVKGTTMAAATVYRDEDRKPLWGPADKVMAEVLGNL